MKLTPIGMMKAALKTTDKDLKIDQTITFVECSENNCSEMVAIEKDLQESGRKIKCLECLKRFKKHF